ncbi:MAG: hypothetical protein KJZ81_07815 [Burkholderiaceae bacterium]|nr:hypothetical protein [Burkholderiaceae bacterium]
MSDATPDPTARELERLKRALFALRDDLSRQRVELDLMRRDLASAYAMLRLLVERRAEVDG